MLLVCVKKEQSQIKREDPETSPFHVHYSKNKKKAAKKIKMS